MLRPHFKSRVKILLWFLYVGIIADKVYSRDLTADENNTPGKPLHGGDGEGEKDDTRLNKADMLTLVTNDSLPSAFEPEEGNISTPLRQKRFSFKDRLKEYYKKFAGKEEIAEDETYRMDGGYRVKSYHEISQALPEDISFFEMRDLLLAAGTYLRYHKFLDFDHRFFTFEDHYLTMTGKGDPDENTYVRILSYLF